MGERFTKRQRRRLRELAGTAYEVELRRELETLAVSFDAWRRGELESAELTDRIHAFHDGASRELYKRYNYGDTALNVARGLVRGLLAESEVPPEVLEQLRELMTFWRSDLHEADVDGAE